MANGYYRILSSTADCGCSSGAVDETAIVADAGAIATNEVQIGYRFQMDIPIGAVIDSTLLFVYQDLSGASPGTLSFGLLDQDSCPAFGATGDGYNPFDDYLASPAPVDWASPVGTNYTWRMNLPDIKTLVQSYIRRPGYQPDQWMGILLFDKTPAGTAYFRTECYDYASRYGATLFVAWHHDALGEGGGYWEVAGTDDDTWNASNDANNNTSGVNGQFGQIVLNNKDIDDEFSRVAFRWETDTIPASATINNAYILTWANGVDTMACDAKIGAMTSCDAFGSDEYADMATFIGTAYTWSSVPSLGATEQVLASPDIATQLSQRISDGNYDPDGTGEDPWVAMAITEAADETAVYKRNIAFYDQTSMPGPILVARYDIPKGFKPGAASTGSFMTY